VKSFFSFFFFPCHLAPPSSLPAGFRKEENPFFFFLSSLFSSLLIEEGNVENRPLFFFPPSLFWDLGASFLLLAGRG